jgi:phospholipid/cholesterol/gamma-HCH transport system substrate-binding protein
MVGSVAALALLILALGIMSVGGESDLFARTVRYRVIFPTTDGLRVGSPVKLAGFQVGTVHSILLPTSPDMSGIQVNLKIRLEYAARVRQGSEAALRYLQWLSGEKFVEITPGDPAREILPPDSEIPVLEETEIFEQGADIAENLSEITVALSEILEPLQKGEGLLGEMIHDPEFGKEGLLHLRGALQNLEILTRHIRQGKGFLGRALYDSEFSAGIDQLSGALEDLASFMAALEERDGALGAMLEEGGAGEEMILAMRDASQSLQRSARKLESGEGLLGRLLNDPEYSEGLASDLREFLRNGAEITRKINEGEGTIGALVNERSVYEGVEDITAGVNDSKFARWLTRHYRKRGIKVELKKLEEED